jgi:hypothetical protein
LTVNNTLTLAGATVMEINRSMGQNSDLVRGVTTLTYGGTLTVQNVGAPLQLGDTFNLFDAATFVGAFASITLPPLGPGLYWDATWLGVDGTIRVVIAPEIAGQPQARSSLYNGSVNFSVAVTNTPALYQWYQNNNPIPGANGATLPVNNLTCAAAGNYYVVVSNIAGSVTSDTVTLTIQDSAPIIAQHPQNTTNAFSSNAVFTVNAGPCDITYQWYFGVDAITWGTNATLVLSNITCDMRGGYWVIVSNSLGMATSTVATLSIPDTVAPFIMQQPQDCYGNLGGVGIIPAQIGPCNLSFQWYFNETNLLADQTNGTLMLTNLQFTDGGKYSVIATNPLGAVTSALATLTINQVPVPGPDGFNIVPNWPVNIAVGKLLLNDSDPDNDPLTIIGVSPQSTNGGTVSLVGNQVRYTPVADFLGTDRFTYTLSDGRGGIVPGEVTVLVDTGPAIALNEVSRPVEVNGVWHLRFAGIPGRVYSLYRSTNLVNWTVIGTQTAPAHGLMEFMDASPPVGGAFYKIGQQQPE